MDAETDLEKFMPSIVYPRFTSSKTRKSSELKFRFFYRRNVYV